MGYDVKVETASASRTVVVPALTTWHEFPKLWSVLLDEVWTCLRANGITSGCRNVMVYADDDSRVRVEVGVETEHDFPLTGRVVASQLPAGPAATTLHRGAYSNLGDAHQAVVRFCEDNRLRHTGRRWERYGPHNDDPAQIWVEVCHQLADDALPPRQPMPPP